MREPDERRQHEEEQQWVICSKSSQDAFQLAVQLLLSVRPCPYFRIDGLRIPPDSQCETSCLTLEQLACILEQTTPPCALANFSFTQEQASVLGSARVLILEDCRLPGATCVQQFRQLHTLHLRHSNSFGTMAFTEILQSWSLTIGSLKCLILESLILNTEHCTRMGHIQVPQLMLRECRLEDEGRGLTQALQSSSKITSLTLDKVCFGLRFRFRYKIAPLLKALSTCCLKHFCLVEKLPDHPINVLGYNQEVADALLEGLQANTSLRSLTLHDFVVGDPDSFWDSFRCVTCRHPCLETIALSNCSYGTSFVRTIAQLLTINTWVDVECTDARIARTFEWKSQVVPKLQFNRFRRGCHAMSTTASASLLEREALFQETVLWCYKDPRRLGLALSSNAELLAISTTAAIE